MVIHRWRLPNMLNRTLKNSEREQVSRAGKIFMLSGEQFRLRWGAYGKAICRFWPLFCRFIGEELEICRFIGEEKTLRCRWLSCFCSVYRWKNLKRAVFRWLPNTSVSENWLSLYMNNQKSKGKIFFARFARTKHQEWPSQITYVQQ